MKKKHYVLTIVINDIDLSLRPNKKLLYLRSINSFTESLYHHHKIIIKTDNKKTIIIKLLRQINQPKIIVHKPQPENDFE